MNVPAARAVRVQERASLVTSHRWQADVDGEHRTCGVRGGARWRSSACCWGRGNVGLVDHREEIADSQIEPDSGPDSAALAANGIPDINVFRVEGFVTGDYLKLRLRGDSAAASFAGLIFDDRFRPTPAGPAAEQAAAGRLRCR